MSTIEYVPKKDEPEPQETAARQLALLPDAPVRSRLTSVPLGDLPPDSELVGEDPTPQFAALVRAWGVLAPVWLIECKPYIVAAGRNRIKAARRAGQQHIPAMIFPAGTSLQYVLTLIEHARRDNPAADVQAIRGLLQRGAGEAEICKATGFSTQTYRARMRLAGLHDYLLDAYGHGYMRAATAEEAATCGPAQQEGLCAVLRGRIEEHAKAGGNGARPRLQRKDVRAVKQAGSTQAVAELPDALFGTPGADAASGDTAGDAGLPATWQDRAAALLAQTLELLPAKQRAIAKLLKQAQRDVEHAKAPQQMKRAARQPKAVTTDA